MPRTITIPVSIGAGFTRFSQFRIDLARCFAAFDVLWAVNLCLRRLTLRIRIGRDEHHVRISARASRSDLSEHQPLPVWSADEYDSRRIP